MKIVGYLRGNNQSDRKVRYFGDACNASYELRTNPRECDLAIHWGFKPSDALTFTIENNIPFIILENPVWGDRYSTFTWAYNGLNGLGTTPSAEGLPSRYKPDMKPWKDHGEITIFGQVPGDRALYGLDINEWVDSVAGVLPGSHIRRHPCMVDQNHVKQEPLAECLARTGLAVTYSSTVGAEAVIQGIPTISMHEGSLAYPVSTHSLSDAPRPFNRDKWLHELSYRHISIGEDVPVDYILGGYDDIREVCEGPKEVQRDEQELGRHGCTKLWCQTPRFP